MIKKKPPVPKRVAGMPESSALLQAILNSASQAILTVNRHGEIIAANPRTEEMFGYPLAELIGEPVELLLPESVRESHVGRRNEYFAAPRVRPMGVGLDLAARRKDGTEFPVEISLSYVPEGRNRLSIAFVSDITERKRLEDQVVQAQKMEAVGRLAGGIAHDFNNLLTIIGGYNRLMLNSLSTLDPLRGFSEEILKASERATALTRQLLAFSRRQIIQPRVLDMNEAIVNSQNMLRRLMGETIELRVCPCSQPAPIRADPSQVDQVLLNLLVNARDAMPEGGRIVVETANVDLDAEYTKTHLGVKPGPFVMLAVTDSGCGMDAETQRHIFEPFFTTKSASKGTGLGLATVYGIVKQNGGDIWVYSERGAGTTFKVYWPRTESLAAPDPVTGDLPLVERPTETILVAEDEEGVRQLIATVLRQQGYNVFTASDSLEALQISKRHEGPIHLLVTDVVMPHSSGSDLAHRISESRPEIKVLFISGYTENTIVQHGVLESNLNFLPKPFAFEALLSKVRKSLTRR